MSTPLSQNRSLSSAFFLCGNAFTIVNLVAGAIGSLQIVFSIATWLLLLPHGILEYKRATALAEHLSKTPAKEQDLGDDGSRRTKALLQHMWYRSDQPMRNKILAIVYIIASSLQGLFPVLMSGDTEIATLVLLACGGCYLLIVLSILTSTCCCCIRCSSTPLGLDLTGNSLVVPAYVFFFLGALDTHANPNEFLGAFLIGTSILLLIAAGICYCIADCNRGRNGDATKTEQGQTDAASLPYGNC